MLIPFALAALSLSGFLISLYFTVVRYGIIEPDRIMLPGFCRMDGDSCLTILRSPQAHLLGVPNSLLGLVYYFAILFLSLNEWVEIPPSVVRWVFVASLVASTVAISLAVSLVRDLKVRCMLCFTSHGINILISLLLYLNL